MLYNTRTCECGITGTKYTYAKARDASNYIARSLRNMGLKKGDLVALVAPNYPETILAAVGVLEADLILTTMNPTYTIEEMKKQIKDCEANAIITVAEIAHIVLEARKNTSASSGPFVVIEDGTRSIPEGSVPFKDLITRGKTLPPITHYQMSSNDLAILPYSSGTTGMPKGVMLTHKNLVSNMEMVEYTTKERLWRHTTADFQEVVPLIIPFFHIFGLNAATLPRLYNGTKIITLPKFVPEVFVDILTKKNITGLFAVPSLITFINICPLLKKEIFQNIHHIITGATPLPEVDVERFYERYQISSDDLKFSQGYGMTETSPVICLDSWSRKPSSIGQNIAGCEIRLVDSATNEDISVAGQKGEIWARGPHIMKGYLNNEKATSEMIVDGWLKTGDIGYFDDEFYFFVTDRKKDLIKVKGFQVPPAELEALIKRHPNVIEAAVIGIPNERFGEIPKAFVILKEGSKTTDDDIKNFVKDKVSEYKQLRGGVTFVDSIPKNASGKILRNKLKNEYK
ncbi:4-coumarate--CoA ligase 1 isoform X2 [Apis mellifera]|uniref:4-coumarate--CoA ligase 1 isoform X2 n=1 Tax=Apis mellifera TaxID=7460 RepID=A0A7M7II20_APIME|nr:4-coumarate--CoA ligase 1 isoform X2 [Apis mellifera]|eukprot:XP_016771256.2 4-coumarate--CoA ligase 1 isoform X2 [Apis mellifera]